MFVQKTRRKAMTYNKPEVVKLDSALSAIQGTSKPAITHTDTTTMPPTPFDASANAYESDE